MASKVLSDLPLCMSAPSPHHVARMDTRRQPCDLLSIVSKLLPAAKPLGMPFSLPKANVLFPGLVKPSSLSSNAPQFKCPYLRASFSPGHLTTSRKYLHTHLILLPLLLSPFKTPVSAFDYLVSLLVFV